MKNLILGSKYCEKLVALKIICLTIFVIFKKKKGK